MRLRTLHSNLKRLIQTKKMLEEQFEDFTFQSEKINTQSVAISLISLAVFTFQSGKINTNHHHRFLTVTIIYIPI